jgi:small conductance mechanosensitive channel
MSDFRSKGQRSAGARPASARRTKHAARHARRGRQDSGRVPSGTRDNRRARWPRVHGEARTALQRFRQSTLVAVALTALLLLLWSGPAIDAQQPDTSGSPAAAADWNQTDLQNEPAPPGTAADGQMDEDADPQQSLEEATSTVRGLIRGLVSVSPKILVALLLLLLAWLLSFVTRTVLRRLLSGWERSEAVSALVRVVLFLLAIGTGLSVISGDATALVGSVGLIGLALSWALQTPIESFSGWILNALRGYYRPGDRIEVGGVFGDVYRIDVLTTTVWEVGGQGKTVTGSQPTGALITFPNWEIFRSNIINYSRDFPYVWDEVTLGVSNESDLGYTIQVLREIADEVVGPMMREPAVQYRRLLERQRLAYGVEDKPQIYLSLTDAFTNVIVRYLVPVHERRRWSTELIVALSTGLARPDHAGRIVAGYPRARVDLSWEHGGPAHELGQ